MELVDIGALAGAKAEMMQADALLLEGRAGMLRRRRADADRGAAADAIERRLGIDHRPQPEKRQQLAVERAERSKFEAVRKICAMPLTSIVSPFVGIFR